MAEAVRVRARRLVRRVAAWATGLMMNMAHRSVSGVVRAVDGTAVLVLFPVLCLVLVPGRLAAGLVLDLVRMLVLVLVLVR